MSQSISEGLESFLLEDDRILNWKDSLWRIQDGKDPASPYNVRCSSASSRNGRGFREGPSSFFCAAQTDRCAR